MKRTLIAAAILLLFTSAASAQPQVPRGGAAQRPTYSPYLNLLGGGFSGNAGLNYLGYVRPQMQLNQQFNQLQQQLTTQNQNIDDAIHQTQDLLLPTGNVSVFNSTAGYFNRVPGVTSGGGIGGLSGSGFSRPLGAYGGGGLAAGGSSRSTSSRGAVGGARR